MQKWGLSPHCVPDIELEGLVGNKTVSRNRCEPPCSLHTSGGEMQPLKISFSPTKARTEMGKVSLRRTELRDATTETGSGGDHSALGRGKRALVQHLALRSGALRLEGWPRRLDVVHGRSGAWEELVEAGGSP